MAELKLMLLARASFTLTSKPIQSSTLRKITAATFLFFTAIANNQSEFAAHNFSDKNVIFIAKNSHLARFWRI
ncbi:MAG: hypothetical protein ACI9Y1_000869 [Lentisphaeria bacterium]|jgi:hypothetical protein